MSDHSCSGFVIGCMDYRIQSTLDSLIRKLKMVIGDFDRVTVAGGAGNPEILRYHLALAQRLHHPDIFILTCHEDCGYGATKRDLINALRQVRKQLPPNDTVRAFWIFRDRSGHWSWEEVFA